ncbi:MAG: DUF1501 domain-containing protein [Planctomycetes bacterium]|nr:DUF1501 domain-containing protein [Planctomycetota bacterium]
MVTPMNRRDFLSASAAGLFAPALQVCRPASPSVDRSKEDRVLVVLELVGGNDGLNAFVPHGLDEYYRARPTIAIAKKSLLRLDDRYGLHPMLARWERHYREGRLAVIGQVGHAEPSRSHFRCRDVLHSAVTEHEHTASGWIGRSIARQLRADQESNGQLYFCGDGSTPVAMLGSSTAVIGLAHLDRLLAHRPDPRLATYLRGADANDDARSPERRHSLAAARRAQELATVLNRLSRVQDAPLRYPAHALGRDLSLASHLIASASAPRAIYLRYPDFDTHGNQADFQFGLFHILGLAVDAFVSELAAAGQLERTCLLIISEFGRRLAQNASHGTDHGKAGSAFLFGGALHGGWQGPHLDLSDLEDGDLPPRVDFRDLYGELIEDWLGIDGGRRDVNAPTGNSLGLFS